MTFSLSCDRGPGQCISPTERTNNVYECARRENTIITVRQNTTDSVHMDMIKQCNDTDGRPGLMCEGKCIHINHWCSEYYTATATCEKGGICREQQFWKQINNKYRTGGEYSYCKGIRPGQFVPTSKYLVL